MKTLEARGNERIRVGARIQKQGIDGKGKVEIGVIRVGALDGAERV